MLLPKSNSRIVSSLSSTFFVVPFTTNLKLVAVVLHPFEEAKGMALSLNYLCPPSSSSIIADERRNVQENTHTHTIGIDCSVKVGNLIISLPRMIRFRSPVPESPVTFRKKIRKNKHTSGSSSPKSSPQPIVTCNRWLHLFEYWYVPSKLFRWIMDNISTFSYY